LHPVPQGTPQGLLALAGTMRRWADRPGHASASPTLDLPGFCPAVYPGPAAGLI